MIKINNFSEFYGLLVKMNLNRTPPFDVFVNNVERYKEMCACGDNNGKTERRKIIENQYKALASGMFSQHAKKLKQPIEIYVNQLLLKRY